MIDNDFPAGLAEGAAFCNRLIEKKRLRDNFQSIRHTLIISPRRYGKTSLVLETLNSSHIPYASIQFFNAFQDQIVVKRFIEGFSLLLSHLSSPTKRALQKLGELITHAKLTLKIHGIEAEFGLEPITNDAIVTINGLLMDIEKILKQQNKKAVIFLDEFQDIVNSSLSNELQASLRDFIQKTKHITFVISGSHRHMLLKLFDDRNKPFYKLFERIILQRIDPNEYRIFLQRNAQRNWRKVIPLSSFDEIIRLTECHAYYFNRLCHKLWTFKNVPTELDVKRAWQALKEEEFSSIALELSALTKNQRIILQAIANLGFIKEPSSAEFINIVRLPHRSILIAIEALTKNDLIERHPKGYCLIDPMMKDVLLN